MADGDVVTKEKWGLWENSVEGHPELSAGYDSEEEAVEQGRATAERLGGRHSIETPDAEEQRDALGYDEAREPSVEDADATGSGR